MNSGAEDDRRVDVRNERGGCKRNALGWFDLREIGSDRCRFKAAVER